jgi:hypothetical protein
MPIINPVTARDSINMFFFSKYSLNDSEIIVST